MLSFIVVAVLVDWLIGDPPSWPHPIRFIGWIVKNLESLIRKVFKNLYVGGLFLMLGTLLMTCGILYGISLIVHPYFFSVIQIYLLYTFLATKCLADEANKVKRLIDEDQLEASRNELGYLVGRDTNNLTKPQVTRGIIETVSENTVDGILAPLFYMLIFAPFGLSVYAALIYKCVNTLDSMVGYMQAPYKEIGYFSAKTDDVLNYIPARLGAIFMLFAGKLAGYDFSNGLKILKRDKYNHKSPNCGFPESVTAGLLNIQLGGTNTYFGETVVKPTIGDANLELETRHIKASIKIAYISEVLLVLAGSAIIAIGVLI